MIDLGILGLDTSHAEAFAAVLTDRSDVRLTHAWDGRRIRDDAWVAEYATTHDLDVVDRPSDVIERVDGVLVLAVDWDQHRKLATPALEAGVPVLIDKPIVGSASDLAAIRESVDSTGTSLFGGSALPFHPDVGTLPRATVDRFLAASGYGDPFYYGVHVVDTIRHVIDADWVRVCPVDADRGVVGVQFASGATATCYLDGPAAAATFAFLDVTTKPRTVTVDSTPETLKEMYAPYLDAYLACLAGELDRTHAVLDAAALLLAVQACLAADTPIERSGDGVPEIAIDAATFVAEYEPYY